MGRRLCRRTCEAAAHEDPRRHDNVEYRRYADYKPSTTLNGAGAAENAGLEHKFTAWITMTGAPTPARFCVFNELHD